MGNPLMDKEQFNRLFDEMFEDGVRASFDIEIPDPSVSWEKVSKRIALECKKRNRRKHVQMAGTIAASLLIGAVLFGTPQATEAFQPVSRLFMNLKGNVVTLFYGDKSGLRADGKDALTQPPPEAEGPGMWQDAAAPDGAEELKAESLEEARKLTKSPLPELMYVPEGYKLETIKLQVAKDRTIQRASYNYARSEGKRYFSLRITNPDLDKDMSLLADKDSAQAEAVNVRGTQGSITQKPDGTLLLVWVENGINYRLNGHLSKDEMVQVAESMK